MYSLKLSDKQVDNMLNVTHRHALFTEGGIDKNNKWFKKVSHIPYKYLRKSWQKLFLDIIKKNFQDIRSKRLVNKLYKTYNEGFYILTLFTLEIYN